MSEILIDGRLGLAPGESDHILDVDPVSAKYDGPI
jgi:hypothetical protein